MFLVECYQTTAQCARTITHRLAPSLPLCSVQTLIKPWSRNAGIREAGRPPARISTLRFYVVQVKITLSTFKMALMMWRSMFIALCSESSDSPAFFSHWLITREIREASKYEKSFLANIEPIQIIPNINILARDVFEQIVWRHKLCDQQRLPNWDNIKVNRMRRSVDLTT